MRNNWFHIYRGSLVAIVLIFVPAVAVAHMPVVIEPETPDEYITVTDYTRSHAFYGQLSGWPHTYEITATEPFTLYTSIAEPAIMAEPLEIFSVIVVREVESGVEELVRLQPAVSDWEERYEPFGGDSYYHGASYEADVSAGTYRIEVSTPDNVGKYMLAIGREERLLVSEIGALYSGIYAVKRFFEKPAIAVFQSPFYYGPTALLLIVFAGVWWRRKSRHHA